MSAAKAPSGPPRNPVIADGPRTVCTPEGTELPLPNGTALVGRWPLLVCHVRSTKAARREFIALIAGCALEFESRDDRGKPLGALHPRDDNQPGSILAYTVYGSPAALVLLQPTRQTAWWVGATP